MPETAEKSKAKPKAAEPAETSPQTVEEVFARQQERAKEAYERNQPSATKPAPPLERYHVKYRNREANVMAYSERNAWAKACDTWKHWPSPKDPSITIEKV